MYEKRGGMLLLLEMKSIEILSKDKVRVHQVLLP